jgi:hypothetical protein
LRKVVPVKAAPPPKKAEAGDMTGLSVGDILEKLAAVREAVASESSGSGEEESTESEW